MDVAVITFPGSNCDADLRRAVDLTPGLRARAVWHKDTELGDVGAVLLPGGFSYGDYLRTGAIARFSPIMAEVVRFAARGGPVMGICNGFQILCECGLLPGVLRGNAGLKFLCQDVRLRVEGKATPFSWTLPREGTLTLPIAHHDGNYTADEDTLDRLEGEGQVVLRYADGAPNGAMRDIAGVCNAAGNVFGLMPHPERVVEAALGGTDGQGFFLGLGGGAA